MIEAGLIGSLGLSAAIVAFAFWQAIRAAKLGDRVIDEVVARGVAERALDARGVAIEERDRVLKVVEEENRRLRAALNLASTLPAAPRPGASAEESVHAIRESLGALDALRQLDGVPTPVSEGAGAPSTALKDR